MFLAVVHEITPWLRDPLMTRLLASTLDHPATTRGRSFKDGHQRVASRTRLPKSDRLRRVHFSCGSAAEGPRSPSGRQFCLRGQRSWQGQHAAGRDLDPIHPNMYTLCSSQGHHCLDSFFPTTFRFNLSDRCTRDARTRRYQETG